MDTWQLVDVERATLADQLAALPAERWDEPTLCPGWRVRDVVAHLTFAPAFGVGTVLVELARARGGFDRMLRDSAIRRADRPPGELVAALRATVGARRCPVTTGPPDRLLDVVIHGQDIALPLGLDRPVPVAAAVGALDRVWARGYPFHARRRLAGLRLVADDTDWSGGEGALVEGPVSALLMLAAGRSATVGRLHGEGAERLVAS
ncbi:maleylpyruvate isomerase family mycothiol-dependent enzyme [Amycolatopsis rhabdoformis]|uniref:Maleylpyruvate isomerase family mycothiol-dependent enzyme n=1 Tax=Amycolatopsis rhabdoformis TaxID=1448059 RepID=A0ABZ1IL52_9PSEU|nr:maleylpyruvate isomerase family mycothiol-dependent enzyme [Amycolatopsis rhabdoformis]WSE34324.1 maleylpyruvate isomerase family mycothiol-dependent enzyme [Amycolatopsis rhabdoformis]